VATFVTDTKEDAVPTAVALGPDGLAYVTLFRCQGEGASGGIAQVRPDGSSAVVLSGLSQPVAIAFDPQGRMYVVTFSRAYAPRTGQLLRVVNGGTAVVADGLDFPSALAIGPSGTVYVTELGVAGGGARLGTLLVSHLPP
jgi:glucose/arabinose dehydrogenase